MRTLPSQEYLLSVLRYDEKTGKLYWLPRGYDKRWDTRYAGKEAGFMYDGYVNVRLLRVNHKAHRLIWKMVYGVEPDLVDHHDIDRSNNRLANLRNASAELNGVNTSRARGKWLRGVRKGKRGGFYAQHKVGPRMVHLGSYPTEIEAHAAYIAAINARFGQTVLARSLI